MPFLLCPAAEPWLQGCSQAVLHSRQLEPLSSSPCLAQARSCCFTHLQSDSGMAPSYASTHFYHLRTHFYRLEESVVHHAVMEM